MVASDRSLLSATAAVAEASASVACTWATAAQVAGGGLSFPLAEQPVRFFGELLGTSGNALVRSLRAPVCLSVLGFDVDERVTSPKRAR